MAKCVLTSWMDSPTSVRQDLVTRKLEHTVLMSKISLTALNSAAEMPARAYPHAGALIIKIWSVFNCMVITTRNCKKMDKLLLINYAPRNWLITRRRKNMIRPMTICTIMRTLSGPNLPIATALKSPNVSNRSQTRLCKLSTGEIRTSCHQRVKSSREWWKNCANRKGNINWWTRFSTPRKPKEHMEWLIHIFKGQWARTDTSWTVKETCVSPQTRPMINWQRTTKLTLVNFK